MGKVSYSFPAWDRDLQERVNATGGEGMPGIVQNFDLFNRAGVLARDPEFLSKLKTAVDWQEAISRPTKGKRIRLNKDEYLVHVTYAPLPSFSELEQEFGEGNVSNIFDGRPFQKHSSCENIDETPGDKVFLLKHFGRETQSEDNIAEMDKLGYRPATHIEAYAFQKKHPELQRKFWIVALGSFAMGDGGRYVAVLRGGSGRRIFVSCWFGSGWGSGRRFLFVRK